MSETEPNPLCESPGEVIRKALQERGWTQADLARILDRPLPTVNEIIVGKRAIMPEMAMSLAAAFGDTPERWMNLEATYRLSLAKRNDADAVARRVRLFDLAPVKEMERRGWIKPTKDADELERELCGFFETDITKNEPAISVVTRRYAGLLMLTPAQRAWCFRVRQLARTVHAEKFKPELLVQCEERLRSLAAFPEETAKVPTVLAGFGIRFVVVEPLSSSRIDGAAFWLADDAPVIGMSVRFDRIDSFWFTLFHEFKHIENGDLMSVDSDLVGESAMLAEAKDDIERRADAQAAAALLPPDKLESFIVRVGPLYSKQRINQFANRMRIHPGIILGQLHHRGEVDWRANREMLAKVRDTVTQVALTDGWGKSIAADLRA